MGDELRDYITVVEEDGSEILFAVEALFDMNDKTYALLRAEHDQEDTIVMEVQTDDDNNQYLIGINDHDETKNVLAAYEIAVEASPAD
ncbi:hypothetical protein J27TS8_43820 [Robertmurraya siralis]|uniref:DUF1292 domain-containing protein n=1 Tax=Robertmurraya siralis TaxID=77777 RepID=A0A919WMD8_9BACI|nr:DUF1292 domain-containing protein [Robertmurraya siralis]PAE22444.1 DUF1292 domain-containing protein [Bacillus sp. 7504-2]GIN64389.1 hypothetical protein J27TS8_43820 [Robertmurraya siralis]